MDLSMSLVGHLTSISEDSLVGRYSVEADIVQSVSLGPGRFTVLEDWATRCPCAIKPKSGFIETAAATPRPPPFVPVTVRTI